MLEVTLCVLLLHFVWPKGLSYYKLVILFHHFLWSGVLAFFPVFFFIFFLPLFMFFIFPVSTKSVFFSSKLAGWMGIKNHECPDCFLLSGFGTTDSFSLAPVTRRVFTVRRKNEAKKRARRPALYLFSSSLFFPKGKT